MQENYSTETGWWCVYARYVENNFLPGLLCEKYWVLNLRRSTKEITRVSIIFQRASEMKHKKPVKSVCFFFVSRCLNKTSCLESSIFVVFLCEKENDYYFCGVYWENFSIVLFSWIEVFLTTRTKTKLLYSVVKYRASNLHKTFRACLPRACSLSSILWKSASVDVDTKEIRAMNDYQVI